MNENRDQSHADHSIDQQIVRACEEFEQLWKAGERPHIEEFLQTDLPTPVRSQLIRALVRIDMEYRTSSGEQPSVDDYTHQFPKTQLHGSAIQDIPEQIGRYRIERILGAGGFGRVYLARDDELRRHVAIKIPRQDRVSTPEDVEAYLSEAQLVASLNHPGIVPVYDVGRTDDGLCYVVSRFVDGTNLKDKMACAPLAFHETAELVAQVAEALQDAHVHDLVHLDVKPANILIDAAEKPYVCDFGLAMREEDLTNESRYGGTPAYMSPEQASGEGHRIDVQFVPVQERLLMALVSLGNVANRL